MVLTVQTPLSEIKGKTGRYFHRCLGEAAGTRWAYPHDCKGKESSSYSVYTAIDNTKQKAKSSDTEDRNLFYEAS